MATLDIGRELRVMRARVGLSQEELALRSRVARNHISRIERNQSSPSVEILAKLCKALGIRLSEFIGEVERHAVG